MGAHTNKCRTVYNKYLNYFDNLLMDQFSEETLAGQASDYKAQRFLKENQCSQSNLQEKSIFLINRQQLTCDPSGVAAGVHWWRCSLTTT